MAGLPGQAVLAMSVAPVPKATWTTPVTWVSSPLAGTVWHSEQAMGVERQAVPVRCLAWAPMPRTLVAVEALPLVSVALALAAGAARTSVLATPVAVRSPWQAVQPVGLFTTPSTWVVALTVVVE